MDAEHASSASKLVVNSTEVNLFDPKLSEQRSTHDAGLNRDIKDALCDDRSIYSWGGVQFLSIGEEMAVSGINITPRAGFRVVIGFVGLIAEWHAASWCFGSAGVRIFGIGSRRAGKQGANSHQFGVSRAVAADVCRVHSPGDYPTLVNKHTSNRGLVCFESKPGLELSVDILDTNVGQPVDDQ